MRKKTSTILLFSAAFLLVAALPVMPSLLDNSGFYGMAIDESGTAIGDYRPPEDGLAIVFFGYQKCGTVCPVQSVNLMELGERLKGEKVEFLFVTLDPETDTEDALRHMVKSMGEAFRAYRPESFNAAQKLASAYNGFAAKSHGLENPITHSAALHVVTADFRRRLVYTTPDLNLERVEQDLRRLLNNKSESST